MIDLKNILIYLLILPLLGTLFLIFIPSFNTELLRTVGFKTSCITFVLSFYLWTAFNKSIGTFQFVTSDNWISTTICGWVRNCQLPTFQLAYRLNKFRTSQTSEFT